jgi:hypothetical protein
LFIETDGAMIGDREDNAGIEADWHDVMVTWLQGSMFLW